MDLVHGILLPSTPSPRWKGQSLRRHQETGPVDSNLTFCAKSRDKLSFKAFSLAFSSTASFMRSYATASRSAAWLGCKKQRGWLLVVAVDIESYAWIVKALDPSAMKDNAIVAAVIPREIGFIMASSTQSQSDAVL